MYEGEVESTPPPLGEIGLTTYEQRQIENYMSNLNDLLARSKPWHQIKTMAMRKQTGSVSKRENSSKMSPIGKLATYLAQSFHSLLSSCTCQGCSSACMCDVGYKDTLNICSNNFIAKQFRLLREGRAYASRCKSPKCREMNECSFARESE